MRFHGQTSEGIYVEDEFEGIHPDVLQQYLGTTNQHPHRQHHQTGAGNPPEENDTDDDESNSGEEEWPEDLGERMIADQDGHIRHAPIEVPSDTCPFGPHGLDLFTNLFAETTRNKVLPCGYGIREEEWVDGKYPSVESIKTGRRSKELSVMLSDSIWRPRAELWVQGLASMMQVLYVLEQDE